MLSESRENGAWIYILQEYMSLPPVHDTAALKLVREGRRAKDAIRRVAKKEHAIAKNARLLQKYKLDEFTGHSTARRSSGRHQRPQHKSDRFVHQRWEYDDAFELLRGSC